ncbi:MAG: DUF4129 domain-containing protein [Caldilineaceae bacterium]
MRWRNWNWLDLALLPSMMTVMRTCWLAPWLALLSSTFGIAPVLLFNSQGPQPAIGVTLLAGIPLLSFWLARLLMRHLPSEDELLLDHQSTATSVKVRFSLALIGLLALLIVLWWQYEQVKYAIWNPGWLIDLGQSLIHVEAVEAPSVWLTLITLIFLWLRGLLDAGRTLGHDDVWAAMSSGLTALVLYLLGSYLFGIAAPIDFSNWIVIFFGTGMVALAFSGLKVTIGLDWALSANRRNPKAPPLTRYWLISVAIVVLVLLGLGLGIGLLVAPEQVARFLAMLNVVLSLVWRVVAFILLTIAYVIFVITYYILRLFEPLIQRLLAALGDLSNLLPPPNGEQLPQQEPLATAAATMPDAYRWVALVIFLIGVALIFALVVRRLRLAQGIENDDVRESILSGDLLQDQLSRLWNRLFGKRTGDEAWDPFLSLEGETDTRRRIRAIYQQLLGASVRKGWARQPGQTPREYQGSLTAEVHAIGNPLQQMTEHYNHARYAPEPPAAESAVQAEQEWRLIEAELKGEQDDKVTR